MKKAAIVTNNLNWVFMGGASSGGGGVVTENLILEIAKMEDIELTVFSEKGNTTKLENVKVIEIPYHNSDPKYLLEVDRIVRKSDFDIVLSMNLDKMYKNSLLQSHSFKYRCDRVPAFLKPFKKFLSAKKILHQDEVFSDISRHAKFFAMSKRIKQDYQNQFDLMPENVFVAYPACKQIFDEYPVITKEPKITFGVVANSSLNKGGHLLIFALGLLKLAGYDFNLKMISTKYDKDILLKAIVKVFRMKDNVEIFGAQNDMLNFYSKINCLVLPSKNEAFGLVVLEAMAVGLPCIVSSTAGASEIINDNCGFIFQRNSFKNLLDTLKKVTLLYRDDFEQFKKYSFNAYEESKKYTWKNFALNIINKF